MYVSYWGPFLKIADFNPKKRYLILGHPLGCISFSKAKFHQPASIKLSTHSQKSNWKELKKEPKLLKQGISWICFDLISFRLTTGRMYIYSSRNFTKDLYELFLLPDQCKAQFYTKLLWQSLVKFSSPNQRMSGRSSFFKNISDRTYFQLAAELQSSKNADSCVWGEKGVKMKYEIDLRSMTWEWILMEQNGSNWI